MQFKNVSYSGEVKIETPRRERTTVMVFTGNGNALTLTNARGKYFAENTTHTNTVTTIFEDLDRNLYTGSNDSTVKKFNRSLESQWSYSEITGNITAITLNYGDNYLYVGSSSGDLAKVDPATGNQLWRVSPNATSGITDIQVSIAGELYVTSTNNTLKKISTTDGSVVWNMTQHTGTINTVASNIDREIFTGDINGRVIKCDAEGTVIKNESISTSAIVSLHTDVMGNVHALDAAGAVFTFNSELFQITTFDASPIGTPQSMTIDHLGRFYIKGAEKVACFSQVGALQWVSEGHSSGALFVTIIPVIIQPEITEASFIELEPPTNLQAS